MSIASEIQRITEARDSIRSWLTSALGTESSATLDECATAVNSISVIAPISYNLPEGATYTIPKGYHDGTGTIINVSEEEAGNYLLYAYNAVTPTKTQQALEVPEGYYGLTALIVNPIPEAYQDVTSVTSKAEHVLTGYSFVSATGAVVAGTMVNNGAVSQTLTVDNTSYTVPKGYHDGNGKVAITTSTKSATPTKTSQTITPDSGTVLSEVTVNPIPDQFVDVTNTDAVANNILAGKTAAINAGTELSPDYKVVEGTMPNNSAWGVTITPTEHSENGGQIDIPEGYHNGSGAVTVANGPIAITPTKNTITETATTKYYSSVIVNPIPDQFVDVSSTTAIAENILEGTSAAIKTGASTYDVVSGTMKDNAAVSSTLTVDSTSYIIPKGYHNGAGEVFILVETKSATPTKQQQTISVTKGKVLSSVTVQPIPDAYQDVTGVSVLPAQVISGAKYVDKDGTLTTGTMKDNGAISATIDGLSAMSYQIPNGYHSGTGTVTLTNDIEELLAAI